MIFIAGIHGVGKTSFCNEISKRIDVNIYSASKLISDAKNEQFKADKKIVDIEVNQDYLITAVKKIQEDKFILDGHFCLLDGNGEVARIPYQTFENLDIQGVILLTDSAEKITKRLEERDGISHEINKIEQFQSEEINYANEVADKLGIECMIYDESDDISEAVEFVDRCFEQEMEI